jgi:hypothetical protein
VPVALFVTGVILWWNRVLRPAMDNRKKISNEKSGAAEPPVAGLDPGGITSAERS